MNISKIQIKEGSEEHKEKLSNTFPHLNNFFYGEKSYLIIAEQQNEIIGFLWAFKRKIPAPIEADEMFINVIEVINPDLRCKGIGSQMVQKIIKIAKNEGLYQVRAYVQIKNISSHRLWYKNKFSINPVKMPDGDIVGSFVTYVL